MKWIKCSDKMPEENISEYVLIYVFNPNKDDPYSKFKIAELIKGMFYVPNEVEYYAPKSEVSHWVLLTELPKE